MFWPFNMDPQYANNFADSYQGMIPDYNPQDGQQVENKDFPPQQPHQDSGFNVLMSNVLNAGGFDGNNLYSDLDAIETPLVNNMASMELYDPLDNNLMSNQGSLFPASTINQGIFNFEEPKIFNSTLGQLHQVPVPNNNPILSHQNMQSNLIEGSKGDGMSDVSPQSAIHTSMSSTVDASLLNPMPVQSFYNPTPVQPTPVQTTVTPAPTVHIANPNDNAKATNGVVNSDSANVGQVSADLDIPEENPESLEEDPTEPANDPLADDNFDNNEEAVDGDASNGTGNGEAEDGESSQLEKCVREGCNNTAVLNPEWEDEYCSNECCVRHCK